MTNTLLVIDAREINSLVVRQLFPYLGPVAYSGDYSLYIQKYFESLVQPRNNTDDDPECNTVLMDYGLSPQEASKISSSEGRIERFVKDFFKSTIGVNRFEVDVTPNGDLMIVDTGGRLGQPQSNVNFLSSMTEEDFYHGDHVPRKIREAANRI